jgi:hypothetical protein
MYKTEEERAAMADELRGIKRFGNGPIKMNSSDFMVWYRNVNCQKGIELVAQYNVGKISFRAVFKKSRKKYLAMTTEYLGYLKDEDSFMAAIYGDGTDPTGVIPTLEVRKESSLVGPASHKCSCVDILDQNTAEETVLEFLKNHLFRECAQALEAQYKVNGIVLPLATFKRVQIHHLDDVSSFMAKSLSG